MGVQASSPDPEVLNGIRKGPICIVLSLNDSRLLNWDASVCLLNITKVVLWVARMSTNLHAASLLLLGLSTPPLQRERVWPGWVAVVPQLGTGQCLLSQNSQPPAVSLCC